MYFSKCKIFKTDNGKEFKNNEIKLYFENEGIKQYFLEVIIHIKEQLKQFINC